MRTINAISNLVTTTMSTTTNAVIRGASVISTTVNSVDNAARMLENWTGDALKEQEGQSQNKAMERAKNIKEREVELMIELEKVYQAESKLQQSDDFKQWYSEFCKEFNLK